MGECMNKNLVDKDEYPKIAEMEQRCVQMLAELWHVPVLKDTVGTSVTGSSEAGICNTCFLYVGNVV